MSNETDVPDDLPPELPELLRALADWRPDALTDEQLILVATQLSYECNAAMRYLAKRGYLVKCQAESRTVLYPESEEDPRAIKLQIWERVY